MLHGFSNIRDPKYKQFKAQNKRELVGKRDVGAIVMRRKSREGERGGSQEKGK